VTIRLEALGLNSVIWTCPQKLNSFSRISYLKPVIKAIATTITATLSAVAKMASLMMKEEKVPFCFSR